MILVKEIMNYVDNIGLTLKVVETLLLFDF